MNSRKIIFAFVALLVVGAIPVFVYCKAAVPATKTSTADAILQSEIDQLFMIGFRGRTYARAPELAKALASTNLGGIILFDYDTPTKKYLRNIQTKTQVKTLIVSAQMHAKTPLLVGLDEEGGAVSRLKTIKGYTKTPSAAALGTKSDADVATIAAGLGTTLKGLGFTIDFAPDLDTNIQPNSPAIGAVGRSFSSDPNIVAEKATAFMSGLSSQGIISVGKHFPGHGSALGDSHTGFTNITDTYTSAELIPFQKACAAGIPAIMVGHLFNNSIDPYYPASLSQKHIENLKNIGCQNTLIVSDDMDMKAITDTYGRKESLVLALNAGIDEIILSNNITTYDKTEYFTARQTVFDAVKEGSIPRARIDEAYQKVTALKKQYHILK